MRLGSEGLSGLADEVYAMDIHIAWMDEHPDSEPGSILYGVEHEIFASAVGQGDPERPDVGCHSPDVRARMNTELPGVGIDGPTGRGHRHVQRVSHVPDVLI